MKATDLLKKDHAAVKRLFAQYGKTTNRAVKRREALIERLAEELQVHSKIEEEIFYPAMRGVEGGADLVEEALQEHEEVDQLLGEIREMDVDGDDVADRVKALKQAVLHHATEEEKEMFRKARELGDDELKRLGQELHERKQALKKKSAGAGAKRGMRRAA